MIPRSLFVIVTVLCVGIARGEFSAVDTLIENSCLHCHDADTKTGLNFEALEKGLHDPTTLYQWVRVFDRARSGEMPPAGEERPDASELRSALESLEPMLLAASEARQKSIGRVASRRLTRLEHDYTLQDMLSLSQSFLRALPEEVSSGGFDTVGETQRISAIHVDSYLKVADQALDAAIQLGPSPVRKPLTADLRANPYVDMWHDREIRRGGSITRKVDDAVVLYIDVDYLVRSDAFGFRIPAPAKYRITTDAYAYNAKTPVTLKIMVASQVRGGTRLVGSFDLLPGEPAQPSVEVMLYPGDNIYPSVADMDIPKGRNIYLVGGARNYEGEGIAIKTMRFEGPLLEDWPPPSTRELFAGLEIQPNDQQSNLLGAVAGALQAFSGNDSKGGFHLKPTKAPIEHVRDCVARLAPIAFRRPATDAEIESFVSLAEPALAAGRPLAQVIRVPLRSMLSSPQFLMFDESPGKLNDFALASRLSYFLWRSMPDAELFELAEAGELSDPDTLAAQVDGLLDDEKSGRFVKDFLDQWLHLKEIDATSPDEHLYPEFDDILRQSMLKESQQFLATLISENLPVRNLLDSDFVMVNRRLAEHYGIDGVTGQHFRKVTLPEDSVRGGVLTQAAVLKVTANGTVTSPVTRGNFVLADLLGTPSPPPPPNVGSIEPDTRGTTTIRETLDAHRNIEACAVCHRKIDPPGFALECFDPIGGFRERYRATGYKPETPNIGGLFPGQYKQGPKVDASGELLGGETFRGIREFKQLLLKQEDAFAKHLISRLAVFSTGAEIQFADRGEIDAIAADAKANGYRLRSLIHAIVQSPLFQSK